MAIIEPMWVCPKCKKVHYIYPSDTFQTPNYKCECGYDSMEMKYCETDFYVPKENHIAEEQLHVPTIKIEDIIKEIGELTAQNKALEIENQIIREQVTSLTTMVMMMKEIMEGHGII